MNEPDPLGQLAVAAGILPEYMDNWGQRHATSVQVQRALLVAMGFDISSRETIVAAIGEIETRSWRRLIEPVQVLRKPPAWIRVVLAETCTEPELTWRLLLEDGSEHSGQIRLAQCTRIDSREIDGKTYIAWRLELPIAPASGYHRLEVMRGDERLGEQAYIVACETCYEPEALQGTGRIWGPAVQLYGLRSERQWGMGDFTDLRLLVEQWASLGADIIGVNPLHALFPHNPAHASPYSPSSRLFVNVLYLDVESMDDFHECEAARALLEKPEFQMRLDGLRAMELVDYVGVAALKRPVLDLLYQSFRERHLVPGGERAEQFRAFQEREGEALYRHALFEALHEHFHAQDPQMWNWPAWPEAYRQPDAPAVKEFAAQNLERIEFYVYLQWQADRQLSAVGWRSLELGLGVGLYLDLAVSVDGGSAEVWANQANYATEVGVGAPPEFNNQVGQDWGLAPLSPQRLKEIAYAPFIATLRHNMRYAGALRLDHVMGLMRQFWVPAGAPPTEGAYVHFPFDDLLGILALESQRNRCVVVGEDLGTVPDEVRAALSPLKVLSYKVLIDAKDAAGDMVLPADYPAQSLAALATHDMPTLAGYWEGRDIVLRTELHLFSSEEARQNLVVGRSRDRAQLLLALEQAGLLPDGVTINPVSLSAVTPEFAQAVHIYLARSPARILMVQMEDMLEVIEQVNIPSSVTEHPNWRRKLPIGLESYAGDHRIVALVAALRGERPRLRGQPVRRNAVVPLATYRLQFSRDFGFAHAAQLVPYLAQLGVSHVYCSPYLKARAGSTHGYDIIDHNALNPEIGSGEDLAALCNALRAHGMGQILDVVPNHMGVMGADNQWWLDVLENGPASVYASFFDIDWHPLKVELHGKVLLPILVKRYGAALEAGELRLEFDSGSGCFSVWCHQHRLPIDPATYPLLLRHRHGLFEAKLGLDHPHVRDLSSLITAFENLPGRNQTERDKRIERHRDSDLLKRRLVELVRGSEEIGTLLQDVANDYNGTPGEPDSFRLLHSLLEAQAWRIADWHVASDEINYRRFFDINDLAGLRTEDIRVFEATHHLVLDLVAKGQVDGFRIDHPDGLYDPAQYFQRLHERADVQSDAEGRRTSLYMVAEKVLAEREPLREEWPIDGTTGYDFSALVTRLLVYPDGETALDRAYQNFTRQQDVFDDLVYGSKRFIMRHDMASELNVLTGQLSRICEQSPHTRDYTVNNLRDALAELIAHFPVYRTYVREGQVGSLDRRYVEWAVARAKKTSRAFDVSVFDFIGSVLLLDATNEHYEFQSEDVVRVAMKFQQLSSPVMAKGYEDTALYLYHRLISLNEVGADPRCFSVSLAGFHAENIRRLERWPNSMLNTSTHDNKRSEDVRARINVLSEIPRQWREHVQRWKRINRHRKQLLDDGPAPGLHDEYLLYQTLLGAWPLCDLDVDGYRAFCGRIEMYMLKAAREAKVRTSWVSPNATYEEALVTFIRALLQRSGEDPFLSDFLPFQRVVARCGLLNSLSQILLKLTVPGVPDIYQGNELWQFNLADPDNRRPVDFSWCRRLMVDLEREMSVSRELLAPHVRKLLEDFNDGRAKLYLTWQVLRARKRWPAVFQRGSYIPLETTGPHADHVCAFARRAGDVTFVVVAPRWFSSLMPVAGELPLGEAIWGGTTISMPGFGMGARGQNLLTGEEAEIIPMDSNPALSATVLRSFPVALLRF